MNDKEWLDKIIRAYDLYPYPSKEIEAFITWLYTQYGIVKPEKRKA